MIRASSCLEAGATSPRWVGKGLGEVVSGGWTGSSTGVWQRGQKVAVASSSTPQWTQYGIKRPFFSYSVRLLSTFTATPSRTRNRKKSRSVSVSFRVPAKVISMMSP